MNVGLISCTRKKTPFKTAAKDMYVGNSFLSGRAILERTCDQWYVLSAKYGLVRPDAPIEPYDMSLNDLSVTQYGSWCERIAIQVSRTNPSKITIIAPDVYAGYIATLFAARGIEVERRPRVDLIMWRPDLWYMACRACGMCGPFRVKKDHVIEDAIGHPCRVELVHA